MNTSAFLLYRLNFVDREDIFSNPITSNDQLSMILQTAANQSFDVFRKGAKSEYRWSLRQPIQEQLEGRQFLIVTLSSELLSRRGAVVTPNRIIQGTSISTPPSATSAVLFIDLYRHIVAVEDVPQIIRPRSSWKTNLQMILSKAAWEHRYTSMPQLSPVVPSETVSFQLQAYEKITRLRLTLRIPNPDLGPSFRKLYEEMKAGGVRELTQDMRNERGLTVNGDTLPHAALDMAATGYRKGRIHVYGYKNGKRDDFTVDDEVVRVELDGLRDYVQGYADASASRAVKHFAEKIIARIDESVRRDARDDQ